MTRETRRRLALLLCASAAAVMMLSVASYLRMDGCVDAGGRWLAREGMCDVGAGVLKADHAPRFYLVGALVGVMVGTVLWRIFTFIASGRLQGRRS